MEIRIYQPRPDLSDEDLLRIAHNYSPLVDRALYTQVYTGVHAYSMTLEEIYKGSYHNKFRDAGEICVDDLVELRDSGSLDGLWICTVDGWRPVAFVGQEAAG